MLKKQIKLMNRLKIMFSVLVISLLTISGFNINQVAAATAFKDVSSSHWAYDVINQGYEKGLIKGYPDGTFKPSNPVTEAEFLALLIRAYEPTDFAYQENESHWADAYYAYAAKMNYPNNGSTSKEKRNAAIDRTKVAEILAGTQGVNYTGDHAIHYLLAEGLAKGKNPNELTIHNYGGKDTLTRAESITFILRLMEEGNSTILSRPEKPSSPDQLKPLPDEKTTNNNSGTTDQGMKRLTPKEMYEAVKDDMARLGYTELTDPELRGNTLGLGTKDEVVSVMHTRNPNGMLQLGAKKRTQAHIDGLKLFLKAANIPVSQELEEMMKSGSEGDYLHINNLKLLLLTNADSMTILITEES